MSNEQVTAEAGETAEAEVETTTGTEPGAATPSLDQDGEQEAGGTDAEPKGEEAPETKTEHDYSGLRGPEGVPADAIDGVITFARDEGLTPEVAQKVLDRETAALKSERDALVASFKDERSKWQKTVKEDPKFGGDALPITRQRIDKVLEDFDDGTLRSLLDEYGYIDHPAMVKTLARIGEALEPGQVAPGGSTAPAQQSAPDVMYQDE